MPFSAERIEFIKSCISERLESGLSNEWEVSFLTNMAARLSRHGTKTRLSDAQFGKLHKILQLDDVSPTTPPKTVVFVGLFVRALTE